jgi:hypothetical protein
MPLEFKSGADRLEPGRHVAEMAEIEAVLVDGFAGSTTRRPLFESFAMVRLAMMRVLPVREQWVNGSFVTSKLDPVDIDLVTVFDGERLDELDGPAQTLLKGLVYDKVTQVLHSCDSYVVPFYPSDSPKRSVYEEMEAYWDGWFGKDRLGQRKGYLVVAGDA